MQQVDPQCQLASIKSATEVLASSEPKTCKASASTFSSWSGSFLVNGFWSWNKRAPEVPSSKKQGKTLHHHFHHFTFSFLIDFAPNISTIVWMVQCKLLNANVLKSSLGLGLFFLLVITFKLIRQINFICALGFLFNLTILFRFFDTVKGFLNIIHPPKRFNCWIMQLKLQSL